MDWLEEKRDAVSDYIRNLSFRKAMVAYILVLAAVVFGLSYLTNNRLLAVGDYGMDAL